MFFIGHLNQNVYYEQLKRLFFTKATATATAGVVKLQGDVTFGMYLGKNFGMLGPSIVILYLVFAFYNWMP